ncbi:MAG: hypothetical protein Ta2B_08210 [Termitinemataceae bacterium]|nr:MAG: hypothetical protein Ta2B_08210 [Termitinemataceae bacterium]
MKKLILCVVFFCFFLSFIHAQTNTGAALNIKFYDKQLYYPQQGEIYIQLTITNNSSTLFRFRFSDERAFSLDFDTRFLNNKQVEQSDVVLRRRSTRQQVFYRELELESGESFSFVENLRDYAKLDSQGSFIVCAKFYPELYRIENAASQSNEGLSQAMVSNRLTLQVRSPSVKDESGLPFNLEEETGAVMVRERLAPDEVIKWTLNARQRSQWEKFFLYLDLQSMISRDGGRQRKWRTESEEGRARMMAQYRSDLQSARIDGDIVSIPSEFKIEKTAYNEDEGTVTVLERFKYNDFTEKKRYTYYLIRTEGVWTIIDYTVINLGTE